MFDLKLETDSRDVQLVPRNIDVYIDDGFPFALELPSANELMKLESLEQPSFSVKQLVEQDTASIQDECQREIRRLLKHRDRFESSASFYKHLSNFTDLMGDYEQSREYISQALERTDSLYLRQELGENIIKQGFNDDALEYFENLAVEEKDVYSLLRVAYFHAINGDLDKVKQRVLDAYEIDNSDFGVQMFLGVLCLGKGENEMAIRCFRVATEENPASTSAHVNLAAAYMCMHIKQVDKALQSLRKALALNPYNQNAVRFYCDALQIAGKDEETIPLLKRYLKYDETSEWTWGLLARAHYNVARQSGKHSFYLASLEALKKQYTFSASPGVCNNIGLVYWQMNQTSKAQRYLNLALEKSKDEGTGIETHLYNVCGLLMETGKFDEALSVLDKYTQYVPEAKERSIDKLKYLRVDLLEESNSKAEAAKLALEYHRDVSDPEMKLGLLSRSIYYHSTYFPDRQSVLAAEDEVINLANTQPGSSRLRRVAINNLIFAHLVFDDTHKAARLINSISHWIHKDPHATATFGMLKLKNGDIEKGKELYKEAISLLHTEKDKNKFRQRFYYELGQAHLRIGKRAMAIHYLKKADKSKNGDDYLRQMTREKLHNLPSANKTRRDSRLTPSNNHHLN